MRTFKKGHVLALILAMLMVGVFGLVSSHAATVSVPTMTGQVNSSDGLKLRAKPTASSKMIKDLKNNTKITIYSEYYTKKNSTNKLYVWYYVKVGNKKGYVCAKYVDNLKMSTVTGKTVDSVNYRFGPGTKMKLKGELKKNATVQVVLQAKGKYAAGTWYKIKSGKSYYYVSSSFIKLNAKTSTAKATVATKKTTTASTTTTTTALEKTVRGATGQVNAAKGTPLRANYANDGKTLATLKDNTKVEIIEEVYTTANSLAPSNIWLYVLVDGKYGYVRSDYVDNVNYTVVDGTILDELNYRIGPGVSMTLKGKFPTGTVIKICTTAKPYNSELRWYKVLVNGKYYYTATSDSEVGTAHLQEILDKIKKGVINDSSETVSLNASTNAKAFLKEMDSMGKNIIKKKFTYSNSGTKSTYDLAVSSGVKKTNCALYVSWAMQKQGLLPKGKNIWLNNKINGAGASSIKSSSKVNIYYPNVKTTSVKLVPGDIVGYKLNGGQHTMVFAGTNAKGQRLWYTAGGSDIKSGSLGPKVMTSYDSRKVGVLIRIK